MRELREGLRVIYVDLGTEPPEFVWRDGDVWRDDDTVSPGSFQARQSTHQLFTDIMTSARRHRKTDNGERYVRSGNWLLVETRLAGQDDVHRQLTAILVIQLRSGRDRLAGAADQAMGVLREQAIPLPVRSLPDVLEQAEWKTRSLLDRLIGRLLGQTPGHRPARSAADRT